MINENWLARQRAYQEETYGINYPEMWRSRAVVDYVHTMLTAAGIEVAEAQQEVPWKPWAQLADEERLFRLRENAGRVAGEIVDVLFFLANSLVALGVTDRQLASMYAAKMGVNKTRQLTGYDGITSKCARCGRALDEPGAAAPVVGRSGAKYCGLICEVEAHDVPEQRLADQPTAQYTSITCPACGLSVGPLELTATGLDGLEYCSTNCAIRVTGGQRPVKDED